LLVKDPPLAVWKRVLSWMEWLIRIIGYLLVATYFIIILVGTPGGYVEAPPGLLSRIFRR